MLRVAESTYSQLSKSDLAGFTDSCRRMVAEYFPDLYAMAGRETIDAQIYRAIESSSQTGFEYESETYGFVYIYFLLGRDFIADSRYEWLISLLCDSTILQRQRMSNALENLAVRMERGFSLQDLVRKERADALAIAARLNN